jgi:hypothetical protein
MKTTDYRVVHWHENGKDTFAVHQVFYDHKGKPQRISDDPVILETSTIEELKDRNFHIAAAFLQDILPGHLYKSNLTNNVGSAKILDMFMTRQRPTDNDLES